MKTRFATPVTVILGLLAVTGLQAQTIEPGLWEIDSRKMQLNGQNLPDPQDILASMPPAQRQMLEDMLAQRGVQLNDQGSVRVCLTPEQARADRLPLQNLGPGCKQDITERSERRWKLRFSCPDAQGEGETRFLSQHEFITRLESTFLMGGEREQGTMETHGRWVRADCGNVPPLH